MKVRELTNFDIDNYYANNKLYHGCFLKDLLPKKPKIGWYIVNLQSSGQGNGTHWTMIYIDKIKCVYFDSFGAYPPEEVYRFMKKSHKLCLMSDMELQNIDSVVCGYYCLYFINELSKGRKLADIQTDFKLDDTLYNDKLVYNSVISGKGLFSNLIDAVKNGIRTGESPKVRKMLEMYGDGVITNIQICRSPIQSYIEKFANFVTGNKWNESKAKYGYDKFYHLYTIITLNKNGQLTNIRTDKNHVVEMSLNLGKAEDIQPVSINKQLTLKKLFDNGVNYQGKNDFFRYSAENNNCQKYIMSLLEGSQLMTPNLKSWIYQDATKLFEEHSTLKKVTQGITDVANIGDVVLNGRSISDAL
jgi:hypothetical protein